MKDLEFQNTFFDLGESFYHENSPKPVADPKLILWNGDLAKELGVEIDLEKDLKNIEGVFSGNNVLPSSKPLSTVYSGHQFGHFSPRLGDGRAHLLGELQSCKGVLYDVQLKGSGRNLFSRSGDGRSPLGPVLREYIVSEAMYALGVPTTRSLCAVSTGESVYREEGRLPGGVLTRVSKSLIRVGHFEYFSSIGDRKNLEELLNYSIDRFYPELKNEENKPLAFFKVVSERQAKLVAQWKSLGFIHGVMNTDNFSVMGLTIDYGPCAFMDEYDPNKVFSYIDQNERYAYNKQSKISQWNLARFAEALLRLYESDEYKKEVPAFEEIIVKFEKRYDEEFYSLMLKKMGFSESSEKRRKLIFDWLDLLELKKIDFTLSFRDLSGLLLGQKAKHLVLEEEVGVFLKEWLGEIEKEKASKDEIANRMNFLNPLYIPRNHHIEKALKSAYSNDFKAFYEILDCLKSPFKKNETLHKYASPPLRNECVMNTFCGT